MTTIPLSYPVTELVGKTCYAKIGIYECEWPRKIRAVREIDKYWHDGTKYQVLVRNWFWHQWVDLADTRVVHWRSTE